MAVQTVAWKAEHWAFLMAGNLVEKTVEQMVDLMAES